MVETVYSKCSGANHVRGIMQCCGICWKGQWLRFATKVVPGIGCFFLSPHVPGHNARRGRPCFGMLVRRTGGSNIFRVVGGTFVAVMCRESCGCRLPSAGPSLGGVEREPLRG